MATGRKIGDIALDAISALLYLVIIQAVVNVLFLPVQGIRIFSDNKFWEGNYLEIQKDIFAHSKKLFLGTTI